MLDSYEEKSSGAWSTVPVRDGSLTAWRTFKREMLWCVSLDLQSK